MSWPEGGGASGRLRAEAGRAEPPAPRGAPSAGTARGRTVNHERGLGGVVRARRHHDRVPVPALVQRGVGHPEPSGEELAQPLRARARLRPVRPHRRDGAEADERAHVALLPRARVVRLEQRERRRLELRARVVEVEGRDRGGRGGRAQHEEERERRAPHDDDARGGRDVPLRLPASGGGEPAAADRGGVVRGPEQRWRAQWVRDGARDERSGTRERWGWGGRGHDDGALMGVPTDRSRKERRVHGKRDRGGSHRVTLVGD